MRTDDFRHSNNVEDDRDQSASRGGMPGGGGALGIGTIIIIGLISWPILTSRQPRTASPSPARSVREPASDRRRQGALARLQSQA